MIREKLTRLGVYVVAACDKCSEACTASGRYSDAAGSDWDHAFVTAHARSEVWSLELHGSLQVIICPACKLKEAREAALKKYTRLLSFSLTRLIASPNIRRRKRGQQDGKNFERRNAGDGALPGGRARSV